MISFPDKPIPVITPLGEGYVVYVFSNGMFDDDEVCVSLLNGGQWRHFVTSDIKSWHNGTYQITKKEE